MMTTDKGSNWFWGGRQQLTGLYIGSPRRIEANSARGHEMLWDDYP